jgi:cytochrome P450
MTSTLIYDPLDPTTIGNPYPVYAEMRRREPVLWHEGMRSWVLTRYRDCKEVLRNYLLFARDQRRVGIEIGERWQQIQGDDPPTHAELRAALKQAIGSQDVTTICRSAAAKVAGRLAGLGEAQSIEVMAELAAPAALEVISEFVGVPPPELERYVGIFRGITLSMDAGLDATRAEVGTAAGLELGEMMSDWFRAPGTVGLIRAVRELEPLETAPPRYVENTLSATFNAGYSTLFASTGAIILTATRQPKVLEQLRDDTLLDTGVDELIRYESPAQGTTRWATEDTEIGGVPIQGGDAVVTLFSAANRDPGEFPEPDRIILDRQPNRHLGFGWGAHVCAGIPLALAWARELVLALNAVSRPLRLAEPPEYLHSATLRNLDRLTVTPDGFTGRVASRTDQTG